MLLTTLFNKTQLSATYCRQYALKYCLKRCCSASAVTKTSTGTKKKRGRKETVVTITSDVKDIILDFFNNCDHVTLNKLIGYKQSLFKHYDFHEAMTPFNTDRYSDINHFLERTGIMENKLEEMARTILLFQNAENTTTGMKFFYPKFERRNIENIDKVVSLDIFHRDFAWCVRNTSDDCITDIGFRKINLKDAYDHLAHHNQIRMFLETIPESEVYLLRTSTARGKIVSKQGSRYAVHQAVVEALVITLLNERHQETGLQYVKRTEQNGIQRRKFENRVYLFEPPALKDFYDVTFQKDLLAVSDVFKNWYLEKHPNIERWGLEDDERKQLFYNRGAGQVSVCALITDIFCRSLRKKHKLFPRAYT